MSVSPYLYYEDAAAALDWLARAFGFEELVRYVDADGVVREAEMAAGETTIMLNGAGPGYWRERGGGGPAGSALVVYVDDVDAHHARATGAGVEAPAPADQPYGARVYGATDPEGHQWYFWQRLRDEVELPEGWREVRVRTPRRPGA
jgi:uncharacterized glyoxalase superfamily protein PhnB